MQVAFLVIGLVGIAFTGVQIYLALPAYRKLQGTGVKPKMTNLPVLTISKTRAYWIAASLFVTLLVAGVSLFYPRYPFIFNKNAKLELVENKTFSSEVVKLDGKEFRDCTFSFVTFQYDGTTPIKMEHNTFSGGYFKMATNNPSVLAAWLVAKGFGVPSTAGVLDENGHPLYNVEPIKPQNPSVAR
jgi:hypothetical protein